MDDRNIEQLRSLTSIEELVIYLRDELDWPIDIEDAEDLDRVTFDYSTEELGIDPKHAVNIETIKQIRPLADGQPWGIFYLEFESKRLPVVVLRRILRSLVPSARKADVNRKAWAMDDLLFISHQGDPGNRSISFAHFHHKEEGIPELRTFSWDSSETHFQYIKNLNLESLRWPDDESDAAGWQEKWDKAFTIEHRYVIRTAQALAGEMAKHAKTIRDLVNAVYELETKDGPIHELYKSFKTVLIHDLEVDDFADMYAQTVTYGLFSARATQHGDFAIEDVAAMIPNTNPFLRELLEELTTQDSVDLDELGVGQFAQLLKTVDIEAILRDFGRQMRGHDPIIHFYETFLNEYDAEKKVERGVFYTPDPVVSFIVRSVDEILKTEFRLEDGLADTSTVEWQGEKVPKIQILDPATGTGTFLKNVIQVIWDTFYQKTMNISVEKRTEKWNEYVTQHLLPRIYGFELMMAPYSIAHMKLGLYLKELGYKFESKKRLRVYLTNALQPAHEIPRTDTASLAHEAEDANIIKNDMPITVIIGNPPYASKSSNTGIWITKAVKDYYEVDGKPLGEANPKWLLDDYVKFIRFSQSVIDKTGFGILAFITNHSYLENPTFRGMRQNLINSFDILYFIDLHGNVIRKEISPDGSKDENVFDIQQGVSICILIKNNLQEKNVFHSDVYGDRKYKYSLLSNNNINSIDKKQINPDSPFYLFKPQNIKLRDEYYSGWKVTKIFIKYSVGIVTARDKLTIKFSPADVLNTIRDFSSLDPEYAREKYNLGKDARDWKVHFAQKDLIDSGLKESQVRGISYRPFDFRYTYYTGNSRGFICMPRREVMSNMLENNICLVFQRGFSTGNIMNVPQVSSSIIDQGFSYPANRALSNCAPLYIYNSDRGDQYQMFEPDNVNNAKVGVNINNDFLNQIENQTGLHLIPEKNNLSNSFSFIDAFHYIFSVLCSKSYRIRYADFQSTDYPVIPVTSNKDLFRKLADFGADLSALNLLDENYPQASWVINNKKSPFDINEITFSVGINKNRIGKFSKKSCFQNNKVFIDTSEDEASSYFYPIENEEWVFQVGGYPALYKWLYDRRSKSNQPGYSLNKQDIEHYKKMVVAIRGIIRIVDNIDIVIEEHGGWPIK
jgi:predicted helicase